MNVNVLKDFSYSKRYYLTHLWKFFKDCWINLKNAKMRIVRGWCWLDLWNMDAYLIEILPDMLRTLAHKSHGYPGVKPFETPEKWSAWLYYIANELEESKQEFYEKKNEYYNEYMKQFENWENIFIKDENGNLIKSITTSELDKKYFACEKRLALEAQNRRTKALTELAQFWDYLWD